MAAVRFLKPEVVLSQPWIEMSSKFCMPIDFSLLKQKPSLSLNSKVDFLLYDRHLEKSI